MSQGPRGGWVRGLLAGLGGLLCVGLVGCTEIDKPKLGTNAKQPKAGLPGTPLLPGQPATGTAGTRQPVTGTGMGFQPQTGTPAGRTTGTGMPAGSSTFGTGAGGSSIVPPVTPPNNTFQPAGAAAPMSPAQGMGSGNPGGLPAGYATQPALADPGLYPPAAPDNLGGPVSPPGGPVAPARQ